MANVNQYHTHYQETIKLTKVQSKTIRTVLKNAVLSIEARVKNVKNYLDIRGVNYNLAVNDQETLIRVNANNALPTTYYFHTPSQIKS